MANCYLYGRNGSSWLWAAFIIEIGYLDIYFGYIFTNLPTLDIHFWQKLLFVLVSEASLIYTYVCRVNRVSGLRRVPAGRSLRRRPHTELYIPLINKLERILCGLLITLNCSQERVGVYFSLVSN